MTDKISSMRGIEHFKNLDSLLCRGANVYEYDNIGHPGMLDSLDVSANRKLRYLACDRNMIRSLNISDNPFLEEVLCSYNLLESIDLSAVPRLRELRMWANDVNSLDFSRTPSLETLECGNNQITSLDMRPCQRLTVLECSPMNGTSGKNLLQKLCVSEEQAIPGVTLDRSTKNVPEETEIVLVKAGTVIIPDPAFKAWLVSSFDMDSDGELSFEEAADIHEIDIWSDELGVTSLKGIEHMPSLEVLSCQGSWVDTSVLNREHYYLSKHYHFDSVGPIGTLKDVDVSENPKLKVLNLRNNSGIGETGDGSINLSGCPELEDLDLGFCYIKYPDISVCPLLREVNLSHGRGDMPDFSKLKNLRSLDVAYHQLGRRQAVDVSACHALEELSVDDSASSLSNLSNNPRLKILKVSWCPEIHPDLTVLPLLEEYDRISCEEKSLDLPDLKNLKSLNVRDNPIGSLDLTGFPSLERLVCSSCGLTSLDLSGNPALKELYCSPMDGPDGKNLLETLIISKDQIIPGVTVDRDTNHVPSATKVVRR